MNQLKKLCVVTAICLMVAWPVSIWSFPHTLVMERAANDYEKISVTTGAVATLNSTKAAAAGGVFITVEDNNIRYTTNGQTPDSTTGHLVVASIYQNLFLGNPANIVGLKMIGIGDTATVHVTYFAKDRGQ